MSELIIPGQFKPLAHRVEWQYGADLRSYHMDFPGEDDAIRYAARLLSSVGYRAVRCTVGGRERKITRADIAGAVSEARYDGPVGRYGMNGEPL